jgi:nucleotide-binding universal stress UspA family protein
MDTHNVLIAIDDSESSKQAITQVAHKIPDPSACHLILLHVVRPVPPKLLEHGGAEDPQEEERVEASLDAAQAAWRHQETQASHPVFSNAVAILKRANIPEQAIETQIYTPVPGQDIATAIVDVARDNACGTVVVGRSSYSWLRELIGSHVADKLGQQERAFKLWVVEDDTPSS